MGTGGGVQPVHQHQGPGDAGQHQDGLVRVSRDRLRDLQRLARRGQHGVLLPLPGHQDGGPHCRVVRCAGQPQQLP